jgi:hypothetical protein
MSQFHSYENMDSLLRVFRKYYIFSVSIYQQLT